MGTPFIPKGTRQKFLILGEDFVQDLQLHSGLDVAILPCFLGGQASDTEVCAARDVPHGLGATLPVPDFSRPSAKVLEGLRRGDLSPKDFTPIADVADGA